MESEEITGCLARSAQGYWSSESDNLVSDWKTNQFRNLEILYFQVFLYSMRCRRQLEWTILYPALKRETSLISEEGNTLIPGKDENSPIAAGKATRPKVRERGETGYFVYFWAEVNPVNTRQAVMNAAISAIIGRVLLSLLRLHYTAFWLLCC